MPNSYFKFKQFIINQDQCAMKVCTDACLFGAWFAAKIPNNSTILDIGSGTGLLMMMLAQKSDADIHGIEIELACFRQLKENIAASKWSERMKVFPGDARSFSFPAKYDFIICNPPFYENGPVSFSEEEQIAKHGRKMTLEDLAAIISNNLAEGGAAGILLPYHRWEAFDLICNGHGLFLSEKLFVRDSISHSWSRAVLHYSRSRQHFVPSFEFSIKSGDNTYSDEFTELLSDYYLYL